MAPKPLEGPPSCETILHSFGGSSAIRTFQYTASRAGLAAAPAPPPIGRARIVPAPYKTTMENLWDFWQVSGS
jgi:hypothetical protein